MRDEAGGGRQPRHVGGLVLADFAPHDLERLRDDHAHRRLGFADAEVAGWFAAAGLTALPPQHLPGRPLTVTLWAADRPALSPAPAVQTAGPPSQGSLP